MYKVFMNDCPIILTDSYVEINNFYNSDFKDYNLLKVLEQLENKVFEGVILFSNDLEKDWQTFQKNFKVVEAAGGKVLNKTNEVLFIERFGKWDLPKGHIEKGESRTKAAIREVEEECGIDGLSIENPLETTYHIFKFKDELRLKVTYWFLMRTSYSGDLTPQTEEGITDVVFKDENEIKAALENTYANIKLLFY